MGSRLTSAESKVLRNISITGRMAADDLGIEYDFFQYTGWEDSSLNFS